MTDAAPFLLVEFYYPMVDDGRGGDMVGDACLLDVVQPVAAALSQLDGVTGHEFMRYSLDGYHLRIKFHGQPEALQRLADEQVRPALLAFADRHAQWLAQDMALGDFGQRLVARLGKQGDPLREGGDFALRMARDAQDVFESAQVRGHYLALSRHMCDLVLASIACGLDQRERRALARLLLMQLLAATGMQAAGLHYLATFAARQWQGYFDIEPAQIARCQATAAAAAAPFSAFLASAGDTPGIARALPERVRAAYIQHMSPMLALMPLLVEIGEGGAATNHAALRVLSLVHLAHNRLGLNILQEIIFAELACHHYAAQLDPAATRSNREWVDRNLSTYLANTDHIAV
ncbi:MAG: lantibiotic dehydratase C-terminal domain-containing protein [Stenotrophomonas sp.]|uniref:lantibiotic dehydratase C-terminal domain-containing protein n=1 Tax=Stenotrophomonas sp. TaxID=69392 RepID=UPI002FC96B87